MGKTWDGWDGPAAFQRWCLAWAAECLRVLKPGGFLLAFGGTRTWHRLASAIEDTGFEIRDSVADLTGQDAPGLMWVYGSGFPKSLAVGKAIDRAAGAERQVKAEGTPARRMIPGADQNRTGSWAKDDGREFIPTVTAPATEDGARWEGWGTALKPAWEPIVVARKPLTGTVAANVVAYGTGALNIDACRVSITAADLAALAVKDGNVTGLDDGRAVFGAGARRPHGNPAGRWPPNVLLTHSADCEPAGTRQVPSNARRSKGSGLGYRGADAPRGAWGKPGEPEVAEAWTCAPGCPVAELDRQSGVTRSTGGRQGGRLGNGTTYGQFAGMERANAGGLGDEGGASRFFPVFRYQAKAPAAERPRLDDGTAWPTVKPLELMRWLVRLVTPPGGRVLDPFGGTGTTGQACALEGLSCVLAERDPLAAELAARRLSKPVQAELAVTG